MNVLLISPHPDDELIGAGAAATALADRGHQVHNYAPSLGSSKHKERQRELLDVCTRVGFQCHISQVAAAYTRREDNHDAWHTWRQEIEELAELTDVIIAPWPQDAHPLHESIGQLAAAAALHSNTTIWFWGLWSDLPLPNLINFFSGNRLETVNAALEIHQSQLAKTDYRKLIAGRALTNAALGPSKAFGFDHSLKRPTEHAELLTEVRPAGGSLLLSAPRVLDLDDPLPETESRQDILQILMSASLQSKLMFNRS